MQDSTAVFRAFDRDGSGSIRCTLARTGTAFASLGAGCNPAGRSLMEWLRHVEDFLRKSSKSDIDDLMQVGCVYGSRHPRAAALTA
jgi:hypothetical protein